MWWWGPAECIIEDQKTREHSASQSLTVSSDISWHVQLVTKVADGRTSSINCEITLDHITDSKVSFISLITANLHVSVYFMHDTSPTLLNSTKYDLCSQCNISLLNRHHYNYTGFILWFHSCSGCKFHPNQPKILRDNVQSRKACFFLNILQITFKLKWYMQYNFHHCISET